MIDDLPSLDKLQEKINKIKKNDDEQVGRDGSDISQATRPIIDLVAGAVVGVGAGYLLDDRVKTTPLFMIIGLFIGMAAGVKNMVRNAESAENEIKKRNDKVEDDKNI